MTAGNSREVQDENRNSRQGLLDRGATFISYSWSNRSAFPFLLLCPPAHCTPRLIPSRLVVGRGKAHKIVGPKEDSHNPLRATSSRPTFPCALPLPTNKQLVTSLLHCLFVPIGSPLGSISKTQEMPAAQASQLKRSLFSCVMDSKQKRKQKKNEKRKERVSLYRHEGPTREGLRSVFFHTSFDCFSWVAMPVFSFSRHCRQIAGRMTT